MHRARRHHASTHNEASKHAIPDDPSGTARLEAFSDAVMAVIITILAVELRPPVDGSVDALVQRLPSLFICILSFTTVGMAWNHHHNLFRGNRNLTSAVMWANLHSLFWLALVPVVTEWVGADYREPLPAASYGVIALGAAAAYTILVRTIVLADGADSAVSRAVGSDHKGLVTIAMYAVGAGFAWLTPWISYALYLAVAIVWFLPDDRFAGSR